MKTNAKCFEELRQYIESIPIIDTHDHTIKPGPKYTDPIAFITNNYFVSDLYSALHKSENFLHSTESMEKRWPHFEKAWKRTCHTGYAQAIKRVLKHFYNEEEMTLEALQRIASKLTDLTDEKIFDDILSQAKILARIENIVFDDFQNTKQILDGSFKMPPRGLLAIPLWPHFHNIQDYDSIQKIASVLGSTVISLDDFLHVCKQIFIGYKNFGAVTFKDQCAYEHGLAFTNPTKSQAEQVFNSMMQDPRRQLGFPEQTAPLEDYLFHQFMNMAKELEIPVQIHTGHLARARNYLPKSNAALFTNVLEIHRDVQFDLLHANWPYDGDILFLAKNYSNVSINFCWTHIIDPIYCQNMLKRIISSVPHAKIHGYGSDFSGDAELAWAHASIARDNIAIALADMVEMEYLNYEQAQQVACDWLFNNPKDFYKLECL